MGYDFTKGASKKDIVAYLTKTWGNDMHTQVQSRRKRLVVSP